MVSTRARSSFVIFAIDWFVAVQERPDLADMARPETKLEAFREKGFDF